MIQKLAKEAIEIQDACNMLGLSKRFPMAIQELWEALKASGTNPGTDDINRHPITRLWISKLESLSGQPRPEHWEYVEEMARGTSNVLH